MPLPKNPLPEYKRKIEVLPNRPEPICKICSDSGYLHYEKDGYTYTRPCGCTARKIKAGLFGENYAEKTIENYEERSYSMKCVKRILTHSPDASYLITGAVGLGKTHLLAGLYEKLWGSIGNIFMKKELDLLEYLKNEKHWLNDMNEQKPKLVQIDDMGKVKLADWEIEKFFRFYDYVSANTTLLQVTTNLSPEEIDYNYGHAITDRLFRNNKCEILTVRLEEPKKVDDEEDNQ